MIRLGKNYTKKSKTVKLRTLLIFFEKPKNLKVMKTIRNQLTKSHRFTIIYASTEGHKDLRLFSFFAPPNIFDGACFKQP